MFDIITYLFIVSACIAIATVFPTAFLYVNDCDISFKICFWILLTSCVVGLLSGVMLLALRCVACCTC